MNIKNRILGWLRKHRLKAEIFLFISLCLFIYFWKSIVITVYSGEAGVLYMRFYGGTVTDKTYAEGVHFILPWDKMYVYDIRVQHASHTFNVITVDGLFVEVTVSIRYHPHPESLGLLHQQLGPDYLEKIILPEIQSVLRIIIGQLHAEDIFSSQKDFLDVALQESLLQVSEKYVKLDDLLITNVVLPPVIKKAIERKLERKQHALEYVYLLLESELEAKRKKIEAQGIRDFQDIVSEGISEQLLKWRGIEATLELAKSNNAKIVIIGNNENGLPLIFNTDSGLPAANLQSPASSIYNITETLDLLRSGSDFSLPKSSGPFGNTVEN